MAELSEERCMPPETALSDTEVEALWQRVPEWHVTEEDGAQTLRRSFDFLDYVDTLSFVNKVAASAEYQDHHPEMMVTWGEVTVQWRTHAVDGLHRNDFIMAARTDDIYEQDFSESKRGKDAVEIASKESFPASDPPGWREETDR